MKRKILSIITAVSMILSLIILPQTASAADNYWAVTGEDTNFATFSAAAPHAHRLCADTECEDTYHDHTEYDFTAWTATDSLPTTAGNYYLTNDVTLSDKWTAPDGVNLCLDGHTIKQTGNNSVVYVASNSKQIAICDCNESNLSHKFTVADNGLWTLDEENGTKTIEGGVITGGKRGSGIYVGSGCIVSLYNAAVAGNNNNSGDGGGVYASGAFNLYGGKIIGNISYYNGAGLYASGKCTIIDGVISDNISDGWYSGVYYSSWFNPLTLGGATVIYNNTRYGEASNVWIHQQNGKLTIADGGLSDGAKIGVAVNSNSTCPTADNPWVITNNGTADYLDYFVSDNSKYAVAAKDDALAIYALAIITQPTADSPKVETNITPESYQWYTVSEQDNQGRIDVHEGTDNNDGSYTTEASSSAHGDTYSLDLKIYDLKLGQTFTFTSTTNELYSLYADFEYEYDENNSVYNVTATVTDLNSSGYVSLSNDDETAAATLSNFQYGKVYVVGDAVEGQTSDTFTGYGTVLCRVTWSNGATTDSDVITVPLFNGEGTEESPYLIPDLATLEKFRDYVNDGSGAGEYFKLTANIDMSETYNSTSGKSWTPIGADGTPFKGTFDGHGNTVKGVYFKQASYDGNETNYIGLFGLIGEEGAVKNLGVIDPSVTGSDMHYIGGVCGENCGTIENCSTTGTTGTLGSSFCYTIGGICGNNKGLIKNCYNTFNSFEGYVIGGICGYNYGTITSCYNTGTISGNDYIGGICGGNNSNVTITSCCYLDTSADSSAGGTSKTAEEFASGEVAWLLQNGQLTQEWGQDLTSDDYPVLTSEAAKKVYKVTFMNGTDEYAVKYANSTGVSALPDNPSKEGYTFEKWSTSETDGTDFTASAALTEDMTVYAVFTENTAHSHDMSVECGDEDAITFAKALTSQDGVLYIDGVQQAEGVEGYTLEAGNYYLAEDIALNRNFAAEVSFMEEDRTVNLCLNGHTIDFQFDYYNVYVGTDTTFNICDCSDGRTGKITGEYSRDARHLGLVDNRGVMSVYGAKIENASTDDTNGNYQRAIANANKLYLYNAEITSKNDTAIVSSYRDMNIYLSGAPKVKGKEAGFDLYQNEFEDNPNDKITLLTPLTVTEPYKVTAAQPMTITIGWSDKMGDAKASDYFVSAMSDYEIVKNDDGELEFVKKHVHSLTKHDAVANTCTTDGNSAYWKCEGDGSCGKMFSDENGETEIDAVPTINKTGHSMTKTDAVAQTCETDGNDAYWTCSNCNKMFSDAGGETEINAIPTINKTGHSYGDWTIITKPTETTTGMAQRVCANDSSHIDSVTLPVLTDTSVWTLIDEKDPTETEDGYKKYTSADYGEITVTIEKRTEPSAAPTVEPTSTPSADPTAVPTGAPTAKPTTVPTSIPTVKPSAVPTGAPTAKPTAKPTTEPTGTPTAKPTAEPTSTPTAEPTSEPTPEPFEPDLSVTQTTTSITVKNTISGYTYTLYDPSGNTVSEVTAKNGDDIVFSGLKKNTAYKIIVTSADGQEYTETVKTKSGSSGSSGGTSTYTVTFNANNGTSNTSVRIMKNTTVSEPTAPKKEGYTFDGWYTDSKLTAEYDFSAKVTKSFTLYAKWTEETVPTAEPSVTPKPTDTDEPSDISKVQHKAYIVGYENGTFMPDGNITRAETVVILARLTESFDENGSYTTSFADVDNNVWYYRYIGFEESQNIITGYEDGTFKPENSITRAEFANMIVHFAELNTENADTAFTDINGHWAQNQIAACYAAGYIKGYADNTFMPDNYITRAEAVAIINRVLGRDDIKDFENPFSDVTDSHWAYADIMEAAITHNAD